MIINQNYRIFDSKISASFDVNDPLEVCNEAEFLDSSREAAKLVYTKDEAKVKTLKETGMTKDLKVRVDITDMRELRSLTKNDMLIITNPDLLRGFDYKSNATEGINLLMMSPVSSTRSLQQALGRVGRYHQPGKRFRWNDVTVLVDVRENDMIIRAINTSNAPKTKAKSKINQEPTTGRRTRSTGIPQA